MKNKIKKKFHLLRENPNQKCVSTYILKHTKHCRVLLKRKAIRKII